MSHLLLLLSVPLPEGAPFRVERDPVHGDRRAVASRPIKRGECVLQETPLAFDCVHCFVSDPDCREIIFPPWVLRSLEEQPYEGETRLLERIHNNWLLARRICRLMTPSQWAAWSFLPEPTGHEEEGADARAKLAARTVLKDAKVAQRGWTSVGELLQVFEATRCNAFKVDDACNPQFQFALALFGFACFWNHSCIANCERVVSIDWRPQGEGPLLRILAAEDIAAGEELTLAYGPHYDLLPRSVRLRSQFGERPCRCRACWPPEQPPLPGELTEMTGAQSAAWREASDAGASIGPRFMAAWRSSKGRAGLLRPDAALGARGVSFVVLGYLFDHFGRQSGRREAWEPTDAELAAMFDLAERDFFGLSMGARRALALLPNACDADWAALRDELERTRHGKLWTLKNWIVARCADHKPHGPAEGVSRLLRLLSPADVLARPTLMRVAGLLPLGC